MFWTMYGLAAAIDWFENRFAFGAFYDKPPWYSRARNEIIVFILKWTLLLGGAAGIWYQHDWRYAAAAVVCWWIVSVVVGRYSYRVYVREKLPRILKLLEDRGKLSAPV